MKIFIEIPASKKSLAFRKPVYGVGVNDASYNISFETKNGKIPCPYYDKWVGMLKRCYSRKYVGAQASYNGCTVVSEWLLFSNFRKWMSRQKWEGNELDKDLLIQGNKTYSPETCVFVSQAINTLLTSREMARGKYPQGVDFNKGKYRARCNDGGVSVYLGAFDTSDLAHETYKKFKYAVIKKVAMSQPEPLRSSLLAYKIN